MEQFKAGVEVKRRPSPSNSSSSSSSAGSSCGSETTAVTTINELENRVLDMAAIAKKRRQTRSKSVPHVRLRSSAKDENIGFTFSSKLDATSFQDLPTTTLCSTEL